MADDSDIERIPIKDLHQEDGAHELATSRDMRPYLEFIKAVMQDHDPAPELEVIRQFPLEKRPCSLPLSRKPWWASRRCCG
jgi:hypothetical protein